MSGIMITIMTDGMPVDKMEETDEGDGMPSSHTG